MRSATRLGTLMNEQARVRNPQELWSGVLFAAIGLAVVVLGRRYPFGSTAAMGPGFFPTLLGGLLAAIGLVTVLLSLRGSERGAAIDLKIRPVLSIIGSVVLFGATLPRLGIVAASMLLVASSRTAIGGYRWGEVLLLGALLTLFCTAVFVAGLKLPMPLWPPLLGE